MSFSRLSWLLSIAGAVATAARAQSSDKIRQAMEGSLRLQRESVSKQVRALNLATSRSASSGFVPGGVAARVAAIRYTPRVGACAGGEPRSVVGEIQAVSERQGLSADLLTAVVKQESGFNPCAVSPKGALGLMQLMPATALSFGVEDPFNARQNLESGARYLGQLLQRYDGDIKRALSAYNAGPGVADKYFSVPPIAETQNYVKQIMKTISSTTVR